MQVCQNEVREEKKDCLAKLRFVQLQLFPFSELILVLTMEL